MNVSSELLLVLLLCRKVVLDARETERLGLRKCGHLVLWNRISLRNGIRLMVVGWAVCRWLRVSSRAVCEDERRAFAGDQRHGEKHSETEHPKDQPGLASRGRGRRHDASL